jgi:probable phosphoglycerate mutase
MSCFSFKCSRYQFFSYCKENAKKKNRKMQRLKKTDIQKRAKNGIKDKVKDGTMKIYIARHGETDWNKMNKIQGRTDIPLNETGLQQAQDLARSLEDVKIDRIICSPLKRAKSTALAVAESKNIPCTEDPRLMEMHFGVFEGQQRNDPEFLKYKQNLLPGYPEGETFFDVAHRIYGLLDEIKEKYEGENVLLVAHNGACRMIASRFDNPDREQFSNFFMENGEVREFNY